MAAHGTETVLVIEDEANLRNSLGFILGNAGYAVVAAATGEEGVALARSARPDLVLLDIGLPGIDGFEVARRLAHERAQGTHIVVLTGSDDEDLMVQAFDGFADDYVVKPVRPRALLARLRTLLGRPTSEPEHNRCLVVGDVRIDVDAHEVWHKDTALRLTRTEFELLCLLAAQRHRVHGRLDIIAAVHGSRVAVSERSIDFQIHGLRRKLEPCGIHIETVRGVGFKLGAPEPQRI